MSQKTDYLFFSENLSDLNSKYGNGYLAIKDQQILGVYSDLQSGVKETIKTYPLGSFIVQKCAKSEDEITAFFCGNVKI